MIDRITTPRLEDAIRALHEAEQRLEASGSDAARPVPRGPREALRAANAAQPSEGKRDLRRADMTPVGMAEE